MRLLPATTLALALLVGCGSSEPDDPQGPSGTWNTTYGTMTFAEVQGGQLTATYSDQDGTLDGPLSGTRYTGYWSEPNSAQECATLRNGTDHWGRFDFEFDAAFTSFDGTWSYCDEALSRDWSGTKR